MPCLIPGDNAIIFFENLYANFSRSFVKKILTGLFRAPIAMGRVGQRSLTSNTRGLFFKKESKNPGIITVKGVLVA